MLKKLTLAASLLAATNCFAVTDPAPYLGASTGLLVNTTNQGSYPGIDLNGYRGIPLNVFAGHGGLITQCIYLAGEITATLGTAAVTDSSAMKSTYGGNISAIPGVMLNEYTLAFARIGVISTHFSDDNSTYRSGGLFGVGLQTGIMQNIDLRAEYDFAAYSAMTQTVNSQNLSITSRADQFSAGVIYNFG